MMQSTQRVARQITVTAAKKVDISAYKGLSLNLPILRTRRVSVESPKEDELYYSMELEAMAVQLPTAAEQK